jgi:predicted secreted Zn-dependent protease
MQKWIVGPRVTSSLRFISALATASAFSGCTPAQGPAVPLPAGLSIRSVESPYIITGSTAQALAQAILASAPRLEDVPLFALTESQIRWRVTPARVRVSSGLRQEDCRLQHVRVELVIRVRFPRWVPDSSSSEDLKRQWSAFLTALNEHESHHEALGHRAAREVLATLTALPRTRCDIILPTVDRAAHTVLNWYHEQNIAYDRETLHGLTQGVVWPPENLPYAQPDKAMQPSLSPAKLKRRR